MFYASCAVCCVLLFIPLDPAEGAHRSSGPSCSAKGCDGDRTARSSEAVPVNYVFLPQVDDAEGGCRLDSSQSDCDRSPCTIDRDGKFYATSRTRSVSYEFRINGLLQGTPQKLDQGRAHAEVLLEEGKAITCSEAGTELELVFTSEDSRGNAISKSWVWSCSACAFVAGTY